ncbi:MAG: DNA/RNA nuclease SfsA [Longimicrobiales bacterium]
MSRGRRGHRTAIQGGPQRTLPIGANNAYPRPMSTIATPGPWHRATFLHRPNRFVVHARLADTGAEVRTHLPDPGRLGELMLPGRTLWLKPAETPRKTAWSTVYVETEDGELVCCDTQRPNQIVRAALEANAISELADWTLIRAEAPWQSSRFDFLLGADAERLYLEVKGVSWIEGRTARFPDAVTARGAKHLRELAEIANEPGHQAAALFVLQRSTDVDAIEAAGDRDPVFANALEGARANGVQILGRRTTMTLDQTTMGGPIPVR